jgi:hypothetical protein
MQRKDKFVPVRPTEQCSQIKYTTDITPGQHVPAAQCSLEAEPADVTVSQCCFEEDRAESWYDVSWNLTRTALLLTGVSFPAT